MRAIQPITSVPSYVVQEEHTSLVASTPLSFNQIPPVIKHKEDNVTLAVDPPIQGFSDPELKGTLYILTSVLVFFSTSGHGFQVEYPSISLHAVSRGDSVPSIYCQLDESSQEQNGADEEEEGEFSEMRELRIIPSMLDSLESIFEALSYCAALHPDHGAEEQDDDAFIDPSTTNFETFNGNEDEELSEVGRAALAHLESLIYDPFEDTQEASADVTERSEEKLVVEQELKDTHS